MEQTLYELGRQYLQQSDVIRERITRERRVMNALRGEEKRRARIKLLRLYEMARECDATGEYLCSYYEEVQPCGPLQ